MIEANCVCKSFTNCLLKLETKLTKLFLFQVTPEFFLGVPLIPLKEANWNALISVFGVWIAMLGSSQVKLAVVISAGH